MHHLVKLSVALALCVGTGGAAAWATDARTDPSPLKQPTLRFSFATESPLAARADQTESLVPSLPGAYASAMTLYRFAMASGFRPPLVASDRIYGEELAGPLQWTWSSENGDVVSKIGKGLFRLSFQENGSSWFRELNCRMTQWPGGDLKAPMDCADGTKRTMTIPAEGVVMIDDVAFQRVFAREPLPPEEDAASLGLEDAIKAAE
jgi:hypothetical protein